jgi:hypothetical protein
MALREEPKLGLLPEDARINPRRFTVALTSDMGIKKGNGQGSFVDSVQRTLETFYGEIVQVLKAWQQPAPKLPPQEQEQSATNDAP